MTTVIDPDGGREPSPRAGRDDGARRGGSGGDELMEERPKGLRRKGKRQGGASLPEGFQRGAVCGGSGRPVDATLRGRRGARRRRGPSAFGKRRVSPGRDGADLANVELPHRDRERH